MPSGTGFTDDVGGEERAEDFMGGAVIGSDIAHNHDMNSTNRADISGHSFADFFADCDMADDELGRIGTWQNVKKAFGSQRRYRARRDFRRFRFVLRRVRRSSPTFFNSL